MYMNGRGPGFGGPAHHRPMGHRTATGFFPGMGFRPMRMYRRPMGFFPLGGLFILPALMFGGWIAVAVIAGILSLVGSIIGGIFEGLTSLASGAFSSGGLLLGIVIGLLFFYGFRKRKEKKEESVSTVDGEEVETEIVEPMTNTYRSNY